MEVRCSVCRHRETIPDRQVQAVLKKNEGWIPCPKCGSHATKWDATKVRT